MNQEFSLQLQSTEFGSSIALLAERENAKPGDTTYKWMFQVKKQKAGLETKQLRTNQCLQQNCKTPKHTHLVLS